MSLASQSTLPAIDAEDIDFLFGAAPDTDRLAA
jgi:hypothetical protein